MSDPMSNHEIEDVLSSIRRLVTQESPAPAPTKAPAKPRAEPGKLVLTPAFRVPDTPPEPARSDAAASASSTAPQDSPDNAATGIDATGVVASGLETSVSIVTPEDAETAKPEEAAAQPAPTPPAEPEAATAKPAEAPTLEQMIEALETAIMKDPGPFEPDAGEEAPVATAPKPQPPVMDAPAALQPERPGDAPEEAFAPDTAENTAAAGPAPAEPDSARPFAPTPVTQDPDEAGPVEAEPPLLEDDSIVLDEAALRELVADILREELQGVLGQRITRNVRKLVRAEIARALASRDLA